MAEPNIKQPALCEECKLNPSKYKCPGCSIRSCGLPCVNAHKKRTGCTGKRQQTQFVPLSQFDDDLLISDYNLLEDVKRVADSARRTRFKSWGYSNFRLPFPLKSLRSAAGSRRTKLLFHSNGMSKRVKNRSFYNNRKKYISWTIEWRFHSTDVILLDHGIHEDESFSSVIEKHLQPCPWNNPLRQFSEEPLDSLKFFIRINPKGPRSPFRELDIKAPIRQQLANLVILEYPVIYVFHPSHSRNFEVAKNFIPCSVLEKECVDNNYPSPKGTTFKEEEIEEGGGSLDPRVSDLMKPLTEKTVTRNEKDGEKFMCSNSNNFEDMNFVFDQGLLDAYSDLIAETNPDDFLDLEGVLNEEAEMEFRKDCPDFGEDFVENELEEGEIPE